MLDLDQYYLNKAEPNKSCLLALRHIILDQDSSITETRKWGMPCFCFKQKMFCYLWTDKKTTAPYILFVDGKLLDHPKLEQGSRTRMKILRINPLEDIPVYEVQSLLQKAIDLCKK